MLIREWFGTNTIMRLQNKSNQKKQTYQNIPYDHICLEGHCGNTPPEPLGGSMSQHLNSPNENQAINHYTLSIHSAAHHKMNGVWASKYNFLFHFLFPSSTTILHSVVVFFILSLSLSHCLFPVVRTLYSCTTPFCSSSGGGCQDTRIAVPLSPLPVTVTPLGAALGAAIRDTSGMLHTPYNIHVCSACVYTPS